MVTIIDEGEWLLDLKADGGLSNNNNDFDNSNDAFRASHISEISLWDDDDDDDEDARNYDRHGNNRLEVTGRTLCFARSREIGILRDTFDNVQQNDRSQVLLVVGASGSGKSQLIESLRNEVFEKGGYFVVGKYDQVRRQEPFSAMVAAFTDLCDLIIQSPDDRSQQIKQKLGPETHILTKLIDNLRYITGVEPSDQEETGQHSFYRLQLVCRSFLRAVSSPTRTIVLVLDDLQFADQGSLEVFRELVSDIESQNVLIIGSFRDNEMSTKEIMPPGSVLPTIVVKVEEFDVAGVNDMVSNLMEHDPQTTLPLSQIIHRKTGGNAYFVTQFLATLQDTIPPLLYFDRESNLYRWDLDDIRTRTNISDNVVDVVSARISRLPGDQKAVLTVAAYLGFQFDLASLELVLRTNDFASDKRRSFFNHSESVQDLKRNLKVHTVGNGQGGLALARSLNAATKQGFLEQSPNPNTYTFSHDRVQQLFYELIGSKKEQQLLHLRIGRVLWRLMEQKSDDSASTRIYEVADHINHAILHVVSEREIIKLAKLNVEAGKLAFSRAAYESSSQYFQHARELLPNKDRWNTHYDLMLELTNASARVELYRGHFERCEKFVKTVKEHGKNLQDKVVAYQVWVDSLGMQERLEEAVKLGLKTVRKLGTAFPRDQNMARLLFYLQKTNRMLHSMTDDDIMNLPNMSDEFKLLTVEFLASMATYAYLMQCKSELFALIVLKMIRITLQYGLSSASAHSFSYFGLLNGVLGEYDTAFRYGNLALRLAKTMGDTTKGVETRTLFLCYSCTFHWKLPLTTCLEGLEHTWQNGLAQGDMLWASLGVSSAMLAQFILGRELGTLREQCQSYCRTMWQFKLNLTARMSVSCWQAVANLCGVSDDPTKLTGEAMTEDNLLDLVHRDKAMIAYARILGLKLQLLFMFEEWDSASKILVSVIKVLQYLEAQFLVMYVDFFIGLTCAELYRQKKKGVFLKYGRKSLQKMTKWVEEEVPGCREYQLLMSAELLSITSKDWSEVSSAYDEAIDTFQCINLKAIALECAARRCVEMDLEDEASLFYVRATDAYSAWGCHSKVEQLENQS